MQAEDDEESSLLPGETPGASKDSLLGYGSIGSYSRLSLVGQSLSLSFRSAGSVWETLREGAAEFLDTAKHPGRVRDWVKERAHGFRDRLRGGTFDLQILENTYVEPFLLVVTLLNALVIGVEIDAHKTCSALGWIAINVVFNMIFTFEIQLQLLAYGLKDYFKTPYNIFAFVLTVTAWFEILTSLILHYSLSPQVAAKVPAVIPSDLIQILRMFRLVKLASVHRTFGMLLDSFFMACKSIGWVLMLAFLFLFIAACFGVVFIGRMDVHEAAKDMPEGLRDAIKGFADIPDAMWTLFELMLMESWSEKIRPFIGRNPMLVPVMLAFLVVGNFFILNLITAIVVDKMQRAQTEGMENKVIEHETEKEEGMRDLFSRLLTLNEGDDSISFDHLRKWVREDQSVRHIMRELRWTGKYMKESFRLCDHDYTQKASLLEMLGIWVGCREQMTCELYAKFQSHVKARMDHLDRLGTLATQQVLQLVEARAKRE